MSLIKKLAVLGVAAEAARRYAKQNPEKVREYADKAAQFADQRTKGRYTGQIAQAKKALASAAGFTEPHHSPVPATAEVIAPPAARPTPYKRG